jgi:hypothetical protein
MLYMENQQLTNWQSMARKKYHSEIERDPI